MFKKADKKLSLKTAHFFGARTHPIADLYQMKFRQYLIWSHEAHLNDCHAT